MLSTTRTRISAASLVLALAVLPVTVWLAGVTSRRVPGWDDLGEALSVLVWGGVVAVLLLFVSMTLGVGSVRENPVVLIWTLPLLLGFVAFLAVGAALGAAALFGAGGRADDFGGTAAAGVGVSGLAALGVWLLDTVGGRVWRGVTWLSVGTAGFLLTLMWLGVLATVLG